MSSTKRIRWVTAGVSSCLPHSTDQTCQDSNAFVNNLGAGKASLRKDLRFKLFKGASIQFKDTKNADKMIAKVATMPKIKAVYPVRRYPVPHHVVHSTGDAVESVLSKRQEGSDTFSTHLMTQVNKFKDKAITGKGIKIGIIDTGVSQARRGGAFQRVPNMSLTGTDGLPPPCPWWLLRRGLPGLIRHRPGRRRVQRRQHPCP